jgi:ankyrin repeat protein
MCSCGLFLGLGSGPQATEGDAVPDSLPERPDLGQLRDFLAASIEGRSRRAAEILRADPGIAGRSLLAATVLGDAAAVRGHLAADPATAVAVDDERGWPPLLYACYSRWHQIAPGRAPGLAEVVRLLLEAGARADTNDGGRPRFRSALKGSVEVNNPEVTEVLLDAGANPDLGQPVAEAAAHRDLRCLRLLLTRGARVAGTWAIGAAVYHDDPGAATLLLGALTAGGGPAADAATEALPDAAATASFPVMLDLGFSPHAGRFGEQPLHAAAYHGNAPAVRVLLEAGAEVDARDARFDATPLAFAAVGSGERAGQQGDWTGTVRLLIEAGARRQDVWISGKPPSEEVADLLLRYGITAGGPAGQQPGDQDHDQAEAPGSDSRGNGGHRAQRGGRPRRRATRAGGGRPRRRRHTRAAAAALPGLHRGGRPYRRDPRLRRPR